MTAAEIRERFLRFFAERGHQVVPSSSLVPADDPTLLFTNAGMNQFKDVFLGRETRSYRRAVSVQKCVRAGGKHNDLDQVGRTARHQTFFEMLGNFSFGDYFKREAIGYAWEFVTRELRMDPAHLWVTVYEGDDEAFALWQEVAGLPPERIVRLGEKDNFWSMGDTGPSGPCSELFWDRGPEFACGPTCGIGRCDCDRFEEFWNLVFMQYDRAADGTLTPLPRPSIDTGMGLERIASILEGVPSNFETDVLWPLIQAVEAMSGRRYDRGEAGMPFRVIADHVRTVTMLLADGVLFANEGRGYVMRRILRRAVRYGRELGFREAWLWRLVPVVGEIMGPVYPEVLQGQETIQAMIRAEEERFLGTLEAGLKLLGEWLAGISAGGVLDGEAAFRLHDTYGFPFDLTEDVAREHGVTVDRAGFEAAMTRQRARARAERTGGVEDWPDMPPTEFLGYETLEADSVVEGLLVGGEPVREAPAGMEVVVYLPRTPFYPEGGGQVADVGILTGPEGVVEVVDVQRVGQTIWHRGRVQRGRIRIKDAVRAAVDRERREGAMRNHTGTHLLHAALREVLGPGARQTGSLVAPDRLRFDFSHPEPLTPAQLEAVETLVNRWILEDRPVQTTLATVEEAQRAGALAFFGEKYGEVVRVVEVPGASKELCGGTHCRRTGQIGQLRIVEETGVGAGMRRIEAVTGTGALAWSRAQDERLRAVADTLRVAVRDVPERVAELLRRVRDLERERERARAERVAELASELADRSEAVDGLALLAARVGLGDMDGLRELMDRLKDRTDVAVLGTAAEGRALLLVWAGPRARRRGLNAGSLARQLAATVGGGGGGRPDLAQAGGRRGEAVDEALAQAKNLVAEWLRQDIASSGAK
jgi:alanyl-tRNA synthetase